MAYNLLRKMSQIYYNKNEIFYVFYYVVSFWFY